MKEQPFERAAHDLVGYAALDLKYGMNAFLVAEFLTYSPDRFTPVSIKISFGKEGFVLTLYAHEKDKPAVADKKELPVKKFKKVIQPGTFAAYVAHFAVALPCNGFNLEAMRVTNK
ncbi:hypothetical protein [Niabella soli]|uniref:Uncharacterized protein n=1 Tax=Niabella soli DSM 19437 TaxID=929713 RepID=W0F6N5_9BACT|nr:hypothetical protein [Niabella soli]AHF17119.1 hypothetical protein NIASO_02115 [Niabella soli DSM 19437]